MGYRGRVEDRERARQLRADAWILQQIADELGVVKSTVSLWVRGVGFTPRRRNRGAPSQRVDPSHLGRMAFVVTFLAVSSRAPGENRQLQA